MKIFNAKNSPYSEKVNFVDKNNVIVGYDLSQDCCEDADWFITSTIDNTIKESIDDKKANKVYLDEEDLDEYVFDKGAFMDITDSFNGLDAGGAVAFTLIAENKPNLYLILYNSHNGYYGHGFTVEISGKKIMEERYL